MNSPHWTDQAPIYLIGDVDRHGHPYDTSLDRRWLWRLAGLLATTAPAQSPLARVGDDLDQYLTETCRHHWHRFDGDLTTPAHRQCLWCNVTELIDVPDAWAPEPPPGGQQVCSVCGTPTHTTPCRTHQPNAAKTHGS